MMTVPDTIDFSVADGIGTVTIDRPPVNALTSNEYREYASFVDELSEHDELQVVVFKAAGAGQFIAGHDIHEFVDLGPEQARKLTTRAQEFFKAVDTVEWPTIAAIDGYAYGTGLAFAAVTDIRYATVDATFCLPEVDRGVLGGYKFTQRHLPEGRARELFYTGEPITARTAADDGFVQACYETREELYDAVDETARTIAEKDRTTIQLAKQSVVDTVDEPVHEGYSRECEYTVELRTHDSANESSAAFFDN